MENSKFLFLKMECLFNLLTIKKKSYSKLILHVLVLIYIIFATSTHSRTVEE